VQFDPAVVASEVGTDFETGLRVRVNQAAKDTTLAFAFGSNLDAVASRYPGGCPRLPIVPNPRSYAVAPEDWEADDRYRKRIWLSANAFNTAGSTAGYEFWAMTAAPTLKDVTATMMRTTDGPVVVLTCLNTAAAPPPTAEQSLAVRRILDRPDVRPLTDIIAVVGPQIIDTEYAADVYLFPGPDRDAIEKILNDRLTAYLADAAFLGHDHTMLGYSGILSIRGITHSAENLSPSKDLIADKTTFVRVVGTPRVTVKEKRRQ
jgi:phage-related baseplate assembly protein